MVSGIYYQFLNCDSNKSTGSMNPTYNNEVFKDTKKGRRLLWRTIRENIAQGVINIPFGKYFFIREIILFGNPVTASSFLEFGTIIKGTIH